MINIVFETIAELWKIAVAAAGGAGIGCVLVVAALAFARLLRVLATASVCRQRGATQRHLETRWVDRGQQVQRLGEVPLQGRLRR